MFLRFCTPRLFVALVAGFLGAAIIIGALEFTALRLPMIAGPHVVPMIIGWGLIVLAVPLALGEITGRNAPSLEQEASAPVRRNFRAVFMLLASIVVFSAIVRFAGVVIAGALLFAGVAAALEGRIVRSAIIGLVIAAASYYLFDYVLGVPLPGGPVDLLLSR